MWKFLSDGELLFFKWSPEGQQTHVRTDWMCTRCVSASSLTPLQPSERHAPWAQNSRGPTKPGSSDPGEYNVSASHVSWIKNYLSLALPFASNGEYLFTKNMNGRRTLSCACSHMGSMYWPTTKGKKKDMERQETPSSPTLQSCLTISEWKGERGGRMQTHQLC